LGRINSSFVSVFANRTELRSDFPPFFLTAVPDLRSDLISPFVGTILNKWVGVFIDDERID